jgi:hypothetical protein
LNFAIGALYPIEPCRLVLDSPTFSTVSTARVSGRWVGQDLLSKREKLKAQKKA